MVQVGVESEDGWRPAKATPDLLQWITVPGTSPPVSLQLMKGWPLVVLGAFAADFNAYVEHLRDADSAAFTPTNSVATSNHLNATAMDLNWNSHRFQMSYDGFSPDQIATCRELLEFYEDTVQWGQDWGGNPYDCMHWNMGYNTFGDSSVADFIARKIRPDGFSTYRRGAMPATPPAAQILANATGLTLARATQILPTVTSGLQAAQCTNVNRIAMWLAQCGEESAGFATTEEYASGAEYEGRCSDLGNCSPGDGVKYKGRTWIQITGKAHYREFSAWARGKGLCASATQFVDNPTSLGDLQWAGIGAAWYWTVSRPDINALSDAGDVVTVTHRINGGENGLADRQSRYARAHALGDHLLTLTTTGDDFMSALSDDEQREMLDLLRQQAKYRRQSLSAFRHLGEGAVNTCAGFAWTADASVHMQLVERLAVQYGDPTSVALLMEVAAADPVKYPDRVTDAALAARILAKVPKTGVTAANKQISAWLVAETK